MTFAKIAVFVLTFGLGAAFSWVLGPLGFCPKPAPIAPVAFEHPREEPRAVVSAPLKILSKKKAQYTEDARMNNVQGTVTLRVAFIASGEIGEISAIKGLPFGLTEAAIEAAKQIRFEPEVVNGEPRTTTRPVSFTFNIY